MSVNILDKYASTKSSDGNRDTLPADGIDDLQWFGLLRGRHERAIFLELRRKDGNITALPYAFLTQADFDPSVGITLQFGGKVVTINGHHLNAEIRPNVRFFQAIVRQLVPWIQEAGESAAIQAASNSLIIDRIRFES